MTDQIKNQLLLELLSFFENAPVEKIRAFDNVVNKKDNSLLANFLVILNSQAQGKAKYKIDDKTLEVLLKQTLELNDPQKNSFDGKKLIDLLLNQEKYICDHLAKSYLPLSFWRQVRKNLNSIYQTKKYNNQEKIEFFINVLGFALTNNEETKIEVTIHLTIIITFPLILVLKKNYGLILPKIFWISSQLYQKSIN